MNKKANTVLFVLGATVVNVVMMLAIFLVLFVLYGKFLSPLIPDQIDQIMMLVLFIGSIVLTYFIYHRMIKFFSNKIDMDKYFDPIFRPPKN